MANLSLVDNSPNIINDFLYIGEKGLQLVLPGDEVDGVVYAPRMDVYDINGIKVYTAEKITAQEFQIIKEVVETFQRFPGFYARIGIAPAQENRGYSEPLKYKVYVERGELMELTLYHELAHIVFVGLPKRTQILLAHHYFELLSLDNGIKEGGIWRVADESEIFNLTQPLGHPYDNVSEMFASILTSLRFAPDRVQEELSRLDEEPRKEWEAVIKIIENEVGYLVRP